MPTEKYAKLSVTSKTGTVTDYDVYSYMTPDMNTYLQFMLRTDDYAGVKKVFKDVASLTVVNEAGLECYSTNAYTELNYISLGTTMNSLGEDAITIRLKNQSLEEKVEKLQEQINPTINEEQMSVDEFRKLCWQRLNSECTKNIENGLNIKTSTHGLQHFTYDDYDQKNILTLATNAMATKVDVPYHAQNSNCAIYSWQDMAKIYISLQKNLLYHNTYVNALHALLKTKNSKEDLKAVVYGAKVEGDILDNMNIALAQGQKLMNAVLVKYGVTMDDLEDKTDTSEETEKKDPKPNE